MPLSTTYALTPLPSVSGLIRAVRRQHRLIDAIEAPVAVGRGNRLHGFAADLDVLLDVFDARIAAERLGVVSRQTGDEAVQRAREHTIDVDAMVARKRTRHSASARQRAAHAGGAVFHHDEIPVGRVAGWRRRLSALWRRDDCPSRPPGSWLSAGTEAIMMRLSAMAVRGMGATAATCRPQLTGWTILLLRQRLLHV